MNVELLVMWSDPCWAFHINVGRACFLLASDVHPFPSLSREKDQSTAFAHFYMYVDIRMHVWTLVDSNWGQSGDLNVDQCVDLLSHSRMQKEGGGRDKVDRAGEGGG